MWTIYDSPKDSPGNYVARLWLIERDAPRATNETITSPSLEFIRHSMRNSGLTCLARHENDDPCIVEVWL
jgi:hypothetical protein